MRDFISLLTRFVPPYRGKLALNIFFNLLATVLSLFSFATIIPVLRILFGVEDESSMSRYGRAGEWLLSQNPTVVLILLGVVLVVLTGAKCLCQWLGEYYMIPIRTGVLRDLRESLYRKVVSLPVGYFTEERKGDIMSRMTNDVIEVEASIMSSLNMLLRDPIMIVIYLITLLVVSWRLTLFVLILLPTAGYAIGAIGRSLKRRSTRGQEQTAELLTQIEETLGGLRVVKAFNAENKLIRRFVNLNDATRETFINLNRRYTLAHPMSEFLGTAVIAILLWYGGCLILSNRSTIDAPGFIYYLIIFYSIINPAKDLTRASYSIRKGMAALDRIDKILDAEDTLTTKTTQTTETTQTTKITEFSSEIRYHDVSFSYREGQPVLSHIDLTIPRGKTIALVGQSGSGKTTLADLLPRFYDVDSGAITIDGLDIRDVDVHSLRELIGNVNQEAILFNDTFLANITFGVEQATMEEVIAAAKIANAHDFIMATEQGYLTTIGDRGSRLSGGQRQRISIARAILKNPPILILDEATSALDTESEQLVQQALENLMRDRTTLVVAHRLSTIRRADQICVVHEGQIVERGTHDELLALDGHYAKLLKMQNPK